MFLGNRWSLASSTEDEPVADFLKRYFVQLFYCIPGILIASIPFRHILSMLRLDSDHQPSGFAGFEELVTVLAGVFAGLWIARYYPRWVSSGRWVGLLPALVLLWDYPLSQGEIPWLPDSLFRSGGDQLGVGFTLAECAPVGYSVGMIAAWVLSRAASGNRLRTTVALSVIGAGLFGILANVLHDAELRYVANWVGVSSVIDRDGLALAADAQSLCEAQTKNVYLEVPLLPSGTYVKNLERLGCTESQLVSPDHLPPPVVGRHGTVLMDRVKVLGGPQAGKEGWVLEYGLMERKAE
jgi:hypothetical protein